VPARRSVEVQQLIRLTLKDLALLEAGKLTYGLIGDQTHFAASSCDFHWNTSRENFVDNAVKIGPQARYTDTH
jgi:hypothetical protein